MKPLYILSCLLILVAIACEFEAKHYDALPSREIAKATAELWAKRCEATSKLELANSIITNQSIPTKTSKTAAAARSLAGYYHIAGLAILITAIYLWILSYSKGKMVNRRLTPILPILLLITYCSMAIVAV